MILYLDSSAIVKLLIGEPDSDMVSRAWDAADIVATSRIALPECRAALAAATRAGRLTRRQHGDAKQRLARHLQMVEVIELTEGLSELAGDVAERRALRGYDAVHLASSLSFEGAVMMTWDEELSAAARQEGLAVSPGSRRSGS